MPLGQFAPGPVLVCQRGHSQLPHGSRSRSIQTLRGGQVGHVGLNVDVDEVGHCGAMRLGARDRPASVNRQTHGASEP